MVLKLSEAGFSHTLVPTHSPVRQHIPKDRSEKRLLSLDVCGGR